MTSLREILLLLDGEDHGLLPNVEDQPEDDEDPGGESRVDQVISARDLLPEVESLLRIDLLWRAEITK